MLGFLTGNFAWEVFDEVSVFGAGISDFCGTSAIFEMSFALPDLDTSSDELIPGDCSIIDRGRNVLKINHKNKGGVMQFESKRCYIVIYITGYYHIKQILL